MQIGTALVVTIPIFLLLGAGRWLRQRQWMGAETQRFLTKLVYWTSLPALILLGIAGQSLAQLQRPSIIVSTIAATLLMPALVWGVCRVLGVGARLRLLLAACAFWANVSYMGFPLAEAAWGPAGIASAGIVNAFTMPVFVILGTSLLAWSGTAGAAPGVGRQLRIALLNPIVLAAMAGVLLALLRHALGWSPTVAQPVPDAPPPWIAGPLAVLVELLQMLGAMGLPLALLCVGAALDPARLRGAWRPITAGALVKVVLTPACTWAILALCFPAADAIDRGAAVLLMGTPVAVGAFVIASELQADADFLAAVLVASTLLSSLTLTLWLSLLL